MSNATGWTGTRADARTDIKKGMRITERSVEQRVKSTDRDTSPPARRETTFEAAPPGHTPTRIRPAAREGGRESAREMRVASKGIMVYWDITPMNSGTGFVMSF